MAPKIKLTYFDMGGGDLGGRAEAIRLALIVGGVEFEDERISSAEFKDRKTSGKLTFGSLPVMEINGEMVAESGALMRYAATVGGLTPTCPVNACKVDMVHEALETGTIAMFNDESAEGRANFVANDIPRYFAAIDSAISKTDGPFLLGEKISVADIRLAVMVAMFKSGMKHHVPTDCLDKYAAIIGSYTAVMEDARIKKYYASKRV